jgi:hypothetical protein
MKIRIYTGLLFAAAALVVLVIGVVALVQAIVEFVTGNSYPFDLVVGFGIGASAWVPAKIAALLLTPEFKTAEQPGTLRPLIEASDDDLKSWPKEELWNVQIAIENLLAPGRKLSQKDQDYLRHQKRRAVKALGDQYMALYRDVRAKPTYGNQAVETDC